MAITTEVGSGAAAGTVQSLPAPPPPRLVHRTPLALLRSAATVLPTRLLERLAARMIGRLGRSHPRLLRNLERMAPAVIHIAPHDLPYRFVLTVGRTPVTLGIAARDASGADASVVASVATLVDLLEGRIDGDTLFFRRDLTISGDTSLIVGLRNVLDRDELMLADEIARAFGPLAPPARALARALDHVLERVGTRLAAMHRTLHPPSGSGADLEAQLERCRGEIEALAARLGRLEARQKRRDEKAA